MKLNVPFKSQWGANADASKNDCGPAALCSILAAYGIHKTVDEVFRATSAAPNALINFNQMIRAGKECGLELSHETFSIAAVKQRIENKTPLIALVNYRHFPGKQDKYNGAHFVVVLGQTPTKVIVHDPNRLRGNTYGDSVEMSDQAFFYMWGRSNEEHGNANGQVLVPQRPLNTTNAVLTRREAIAIAYKGVLGRVPNKSELDRWDASQKSIDICIKELLDSLEYPQKIAALKEEVEKLRKGNDESGGIIDGHLKKIWDLEREVEKQKVKIKEEAAKLEGAEKSAEHALDRGIELGKELKLVNRALVLARSSNKDLITRLANKDEEIAEAVERVTLDLAELVMFGENWKQASGVSWIIEGFSRIFRGGELSE